MGNSDFLLSKGLSAGLGLGLRGVTVVVVVVAVLLFETDEVIGVEETTLVDIYTDVPQQEHDGPHLPREGGGGLR